MRTPHSRRAVCAARRRVDLIYSAIILTGISLLDSTAPIQLGRRISAPVFVQVQVQFRELWHARLTVFVRIQ